MKATTIVIVFLMGVCVLAGATGRAYGEARVLEFNLAVDDSWSWSVTDDETTVCDELSVNSTDNLTYTLTGTVTEDNGDGTFDVNLASSNIVLTQNGGTPHSQTSGSDTLTMTQGRGRWTHEPDPALVMPGLIPTGYDQGTVAGDQTGPFIATAVDVNDTWYSSRKVTLYNQSEQTITATSTLLEWTVLSGRNVAKVETTWTQPVSIHNGVQQTVTSGNLDVTETVWFDYEAHVVAKSVTQADGTLTVATSEAAPNDQYSVVVSSTSTEILD